MTFPRQTSDESPGPNEVNRFHDKADTDSSAIAIHHSLGLSHNQASPGDHTHNGRNSKPLLEGTTLTDASNPPTQAEVQQCINALRQLGAS